MAETLGVATLELVADGTKLDQGLDDWKEKAGSAARVGGEKFKAGVEKETLPATIALGAVVAGARVAIDAAGDLGEQISKNNVVFGDAGKEINAWSKTTAKAFGISQKAALEATGTFGNMLIPMGISKKRAAEMSKTMVGLAADMASFNNASPEETLAAISSGLAGESEPLRRFGVFLNADRIAAEAMALGLGKAKKGTEEDTAARLKANDALLNEEKARVKLAKEIKEHGKNSLEAREAQNDLDKAQLAVKKSAEGSASSLSASAKAQATYSLIMKDMQKSGSVGDFARTSDSAANAQRIQAAEAENLKIKIGQGLMPIMKMYQRAVATLTGFMAEHTTATKIGIGVIAGLAAGILVLSGTLKVVGLVKDFTVAIRAMNFALLGNPIVLVIAGLVALGVALVVAYKKSETFREIVDKALDVVKVAFDKVKTAGQAVANFLDGPLSVAVGAAKLYIAGWKLALGSIVTVLGKIEDGIRWLAKTGVDLIGKVRDGVAGPLEKIAGFFEAIWTPLGKIVSGAEWLIRNAGKLGGLLGKLPFFGSGDTGNRIPTDGAGAVGSLLGANPLLGHAAAIGAAHGLSITSGLRAWDTGSKHSQGKAIDISNTYRGDPDGTPEMDAAFPALVSYAFGAGRGLIDELFYDPARYSVDRGQLGNFIVGGHGDHIHVGIFGEGGIVTRPTVALIGERGPEAVVPLDALGRGSQTVHINVEKMYAADPTEIQLLVASMMRRLAMP